MKVTMTVVVLVLMMGLSVMAQKEPKKDMVNGHFMYSVLNKGDIPAIYDPQFIDAKQAIELYFEDEPLMVVSGANNGHAYSTWHLDRHEIVNDRIDGKPLAVTW